MRKAYRRLLFALAASVIFNIAAYATGLFTLVILPVGAMFVFALPNYGHSAETAAILIFSPIVAYTVVFWTVGTVWKMLLELYE